MPVTAPSPAPVQTIIRIVVNGQVEPQAVQYLRALLKRLGRNYHLRAREISIDVQRGDGDGDQSA